MFFRSQTDKQREEYQDFLQIAGCLSNLFSDSPIPYLYYRVAEKVFCRAFEAEDLSRSDVSADAKKGTLGVGLKTFLIGNGKSYQKVAEFNSERPLYENLSTKELVKKIAELRNERIAFTENAHGLEKSIYHCVVRDTGKFKIYEESMEEIDISNIRILREGTSAIAFTDGKHEYSFLLSKSTLTKKFITSSIIYEFDVDILEDPLTELQSLLAKQELSLKEDTYVIDTVWLPLYSPKTQDVQAKSALNQWNAEGRERNINEAYISIPAEVHHNAPDFFPDRDTPFSLKLPNGEVMKSKVCQDNNKALMSYSNRELGKWILRDVLQLKEGELLTYEKLQKIGIDSVRIDKINDLEFEINFAKSGSYEEFRESWENS